LDVSICALCVSSKKSVRFTWLDEETQNTLITGLLLKAGKPEKRHPPVALGKPSWTI
jgi:hypothetical protein